MPLNLNPLIKSGIDDDDEDVADVDDDDGYKTTVIASGLYELQKVHIAHNSRHILTRAGVVQCSSYIVSCTHLYTSVYGFNSFRAVCRMYLI